MFKLKIIFSSLCNTYLCGHVQNTNEKKTVQVFLFYKIANLRYMYDSDTKKYFCFQKHLEIPSKRSNVSWCSSAKILFKNLYFWGGEFQNNKINSILMQLIVFYHIKNHK